MEMTINDIQWQCTLVRVCFESGLPLGWSTRKPERGKQSKRKRECCEITLLGMCGQRCNAESWTCGRGGGLRRRCVYGFRRVSMRMCVSLVSFLVSSGGWVFGFVVGSYDDA